MTIVYLMRHSEPFKSHIGIEISEETIFEKNKKCPLSVNGEKLAERISNLDEFKNLDTIWSSDYVRAMSTAKYFAMNNKIKTNISYELGERKLGVNSWEELPSDFEKKQFENENYKIGNGESQIETRKRMLKSLTNILDNYDGKRILIVGHATAFAFLLKEWCEVNYQDVYMYNNIRFFDGNWDYCETFKLEFNDKKLVNIEKIRLE